MTLDHIVINTVHHLDEARALFVDLGFRVTPRGYHSLGSINHLMVNPDAYLELVGVPETGPQRPEILSSPPGLNGLVFRSEDAEATYDHLSGAGLSPLEPLAFSRRVELGDTVKEARFRTVRLAPGTFPAGRVYFCQHLTPELIWQRGWLEHPNGFTGFSDIVVDSPEPAAEAQRFATATGGEVRAQAGERAIDLEGFVVRVRPGPTARFSAVTLRFTDLSEVAGRAAAAAGAHWRRLGPREGVIEIAGLGLVLRCKADH